MRQFMLLLLVVASLSYATTKSYDAVPFKNYIGVQTNGRDGVSQYIRNTLDELTQVSVWIGDTGMYSVEVKDSNTVVAGSYNVPAHKQWAWLDFDFDTNLVAPVRGKDYKVIVTRQSGAPISFAHCDTMPIAV